MMEEYPWLEELNRMEKEDPWRRECLARVIERTAAYEQAVQALTREQRQAVEDYIAACEELEHASVFLAYGLGGENCRQFPVPGRNKPFFPV